MTTYAKIASTLLLSTLALAGNVPASAEDAGIHQVAPFQAAVLTVGSKRAVGYYTTDAGKACDLTLLLADAYSDANVAQPGSEPVRVTMIVHAGTSARVDSLEGSLAFACAPGATAMTIQPVQHFAYNAAAK
jgi:hypothetical protein